MPGGKGKKFVKRTPKKSSTNKCKQQTPSSKPTGLDDPVINSPNYNRKNNFEIATLPGMARASLQEGDAVFDIEVGESEDEFMEEEQALTGASNAQKSIEVEKVLTALKGGKKARLELDGEGRKEGEVEKSPTLLQQQSLSTNNNAAIYIRSASGLDANQSFGSRDQDSAVMMQQMTQNERFMEGFAEFMKKKGFIYREPTSRRSEPPQEISASFVSAAA